MDTSFWTQCNPNIQFERTAKRFYNQYLYRLVLTAPGGRAINEYDSVSEGLDHLRARNYNYAGSWGAARREVLKNADAVFLEHIKNVKYNDKLKVKVRIEDPYVQIYADSEDVLQEIVINHFPVHCTNYLYAISAPESTDAQKALESGAIIRRKTIDYRYKITLRDGHYRDQTKDTLYNYLETLGAEQVRVPKSIRTSLSKQGNGFIWSGYFYANDPGITSFLNLISPGLVVNIHELVTIPDK